MRRFNLRAVGVAALARVRMFDMWGNALPFGLEHTNTFWVDRCDAPTLVSYILEV